MYSPIPIDGLILSHSSFIYQKKGNDIYKWKPEITIDFQIKIINCKKDLYELQFFTFENNNLVIFTDDQYTTFFITTKSVLKEKDIIEVKHIKDNHWEILKFRYDKIKPNHTQVAYNNLEIIKNPYDITEKKIL